MPPAISQIALSVGAPLKILEMLEDSDSEALMPKTSRTTPAMTRPASSGKLPISSGTMMSDMGCAFGFTRALFADEPQRAAQVRQFGWRHIGQRQAHELILGKNRG